MTPAPEPEPRPRTSGYRQKRRAIERARRRRRLAQRLGAAGVLFLVIAVVYTVVAGVGGDGADTGDGGGSGDGGGEAGFVLVHIADGDQVPVRVLLASDAEPTYILGLPSDTLLEGPQGFDPLADLLASYDPGEVNFDTLFGSRPTAEASLDWDGLRGLLPDRGEGANEGWPEDLEATPAAAETVAQALGVIAQRSTEEEVDFGSAGEGDLDALRETMTALAPAPGVTAVLPGATVEGLGYTYYEPDLAALQRLLGQEQTAAPVEVEVQNGSGVVGVAQRVTEAIEPLGFTMLPPKNAEQFPNVENTRVLAAPNVLSEGERVREALGVGQVVPREDLPAGRVVVVVGKDMPVDSLPGG